MGFQFKEGRITSLTVESSAARNGLLIDHNLLEVREYYINSLGDGVPRMFRCKQIDR